MIDIIVFDKGILLGIFTVPKPSNNDIITIYEQVSFKNNSPINIMYFNDMDYGITITDELANTYNKNKGKVDKK